MNEQPTRAAVAMIAASAFFALMGAAVKHASPLVDPAEMVFWRSLVAVVVVGGVATASGQSLRPVNLRMHLVRAMVGVASMWTYFVAISRLNLGDAVLLTYLSPMLVAVFSPVMIGESAPRAVWLALPIGLLGVGLVAGPHGAWDPIGVAAGLGAAVLAALAYLSVRTLARTDGALAVVFWFGMLAVVVSAPALAWSAVPEHPAILPDLLFAGIAGSIAQLLMTWSYANARAARVAVYGYLTPVFAYALGMGLLGDVPDGMRIAGAALVLIAGIAAGR